VDDEYIAEMIQSRPASLVGNNLDDKLILRDENQYPPDGLPPMPLHHMIRDSIARAYAVYESAKDDKKAQVDASRGVEVLQKLYSNIILTGGGLP